METLSREQCRRRRHISIQLLPHCLTVMAYNTTRPIRNSAVHLSLHDGLIIDPSIETVHGV